MNANLFARKIEMTKTEAKEAGKLNSEAFKELRQLMEMYPGYEIQIKTTTKRKVELKGLGYDYMRDYIQKSTREDKAAVMNDPAVLAELDKVEKLIDGKGRTLLRESGTEPVIRVMIEAETEKKCAEYADQIVDVIIKGGHSVG